MLEEIEPALQDPGFDLSKAIVILDLPGLGVRECKPVSLDLALETVHHLTQLLATAADFTRWRRELDRCIAQGLTPIIKIHGDASGGSIEIHGTRIAATAQA